MTIRGDLEAMIGLAADPSKTVADIMDWLTSADVLLYLQSQDADVAGWTYAVATLREKCAE